MALSKQMEIFCQHYVLSRNATESAKQAGYSEKAASNQGSRLLRREDVKTRVEELEETFTTEVDVINELEKQYAYANAQGHTNSAIKALEMLSRARGNSPDRIEQTSESLEKEIIRCLEILGEDLAVELISKCNWNYSLPTDEEQEESEKIIEKQTKEDK
jgi:phage terminase small subunit